MRPIAYFSAEYAFDDLPIFAGGLGVLASDYLKEVADSKYPFVFVGLFYHYGFESSTGERKHKLDPASTGWQIAEESGQRLVSTVRLNGKTIAFQAWTKQFGESHVYLLDCDIEENPKNIRKLTANLYDKDFETKVVQDALLGVGGVELLGALGIEPSLYHLNEGHSGLATLALLKQQHIKKPHATIDELKESVKEQTVATKHTVLSGAGLYISRQLYMQIFGEYLQSASLPPEEIFKVGRDPIRQDEFSTTRLMLSLSRSNNAVSELHAVSEEEVHGGNPYGIFSINNGIYLPRWQHEEVAEAKNATTLWQVHNKCRERLVVFINDQIGSQLRTDVLTVVWARRITAYKRPLELFQDISMLQRIVNNDERPIQIIIAGKPNVEDDIGVDMARQIGEHAMNPAFGNRLVYLEAYDLATARYLVQGADVWLNTPERGYEASGTSGMKAGANGVLQCSVSDGWVDEIDLKNIGWKLPDINVADVIYGYLEHHIAPLFYDRNEKGIPKEWSRLMLKNRKVVEKGFTTKHMLDGYIKRLYRLPEMS